MRTIVFILIFFIGSYTVNAQWQWSNPNPFGWSFQGIHFLNDTDGYICGEKGKIYRTNDAGESWQEMPSGLNDVFVNIYFINNNMGFVRTAEGDLYRTHDGGENWALANPPSSKINDFTFVNDTVGYACSDGAVFKTIDTGITWAQTSLFTQFDINALYFVNENLGFAVGNMRCVYKTTNGGQTWSTTSGDPYLTLYDVFFVSENIGYVVGSDHFMMKTSDGGQNWNIFSTTASVTNIYFIDENTAYGLSSGQLVKSTNGAQSWSAVGMTDCRSYCFLDTNTVFGVGSYGRILKSEDAGATFTNFTQAVTTGNIVDIHFGDEQTGYAVIGVNEPSFSAEILKTTNAGESWAKVSTISERSPGNVFFTSPAVGYVSFSGGRLFKTIDGAESWSELQTGISSAISGITFTSPDVGYLVTEFTPATILKTTDAGQNWQVVCTSAISSFRAIQFVNDNTGFAITFGSFFRTDDGGENWTEIVIDETATFLDLFFVNETTGYIGGFSGDCYRTDDGGLSWDFRPLPGYYALMRFFFLNENEGFALADGGSFFQTNDGGNSWTKNEEMPFRWFNGIWFTTDHTGYICGDGGLIMKTENGGAVSLKENQTKSTPGYLYPNPASQIVKIKTENGLLPTSIRFFNTTGQLVKILKINNLDEDIVVSNLPSGLYFYVIDFKNSQPTSGKLLRFD